MDVLLEPETVRWLAPTAAAFTAILVSITTFAMSRARDRQIQRAKLIRALTADFYSQEDLRELFADIDALAIGIAPNSKRWGSEFRVEGSRREAAVIHLLDYLNTVGHAQQRGALPVGDLAGTTIGYMVFRTWADQAIQNYLAYVRKSDEASGFMGAGFQHFYSLAAALDAWSQERGGHAWHHGAVLRSGWQARMHRRRRRPL